MERNRNPSDWQRMMRGRLIDEGIDLNEHTDAALTLCAAEIERLLSALSAERERCALVAERFCRSNIREIDIERALGAAIRAHQGI